MALLRIIALALTLGVVANGTLLSDGVLLGDGVLIGDDGTGIDPHGMQPSPDACIGLDPEGRQ